MIPIAGAVRLGEYRVHGFRLSIPFLLLWVVLLPLLVLAVPVLLIAAMCARVSPLRAVTAPFQILAAVKGTHVEVVNDRLSVLLNIF
jgi:hypothetical protein